MPDLRSSYCMYIYIWLALIVLYFCLFYIICFYVLFSISIKSIQYTQYKRNKTPNPANAQTKPKPKPTTPPINTTTTTTTTTPPRFSARLCCQSVPMVYKSSTHSSKQYRRYLQMADNQNEDEQAQLLGEEGVRANQPGQNLKLG